MTTLTVGSSQQYTTISAAVAAAQPGDTINIMAGTYTNDFPGIINGLTIQGVGGAVHLVATTAPLNGKAIFDVEGNTTLANLDFSGATASSGNGAGVRYESGNLTIKNSSFHNNQDGILGAADPSGTITIDGSEFYDNGAGDGSTHNMYIGDIAKFTLTNSYVHDVNAGHEVKSRAETNDIENNRIFDNAGDGSYSIDLPNGGNATIKNNVIEKGVNVGNHVFIAYGEEGGLHAGSSVTISGNTLVNDSAAGTAIWDAAKTAMTLTGNTEYDVGTIDSTGTNSGGFTALSARPTLDTSSPITTSGSTTAPPPVTTAPDTTPPTLSVTESVSGPTHATSVLLSGTVSDAGSGVLGIEVVDTLGGNAITLGAATIAADGTWSFTASNLADGAHSFSATAQDKAMNATTASAGPAVTVDTVAPTLTASEQISGTTTSTSDALSGTVGDTGTGVAQVEMYDATGGKTVDLGAATVNGSGWSFTASGLATGSHAFSVVATDKAGNSTTQSAGAAVTVQGATTPPPTTTNPPPTTSSPPASTDSTPPVLGPVSESVSGATSTRTEVLRGTVSDSGGSGVAAVTVAAVSGGKLTVLGAATLGANGSWSFTTPALADGSYSFLVQASDKAGNLSPTKSAGAALTVDTVAPQVTSATESVSGTTTSTRDVLSGSASDSGSGVAKVTIYDTVGSRTVSLGSATVSNGQWSFTASSLATGTHAFTAVATDAAGNSSAAVSTGPAVTVQAASSVPTPGAGSTPTPAATTIDGVKQNANGTLVVSGHAAAGTTVQLVDTIYGSSFTPGQIKAAADGSWSVNVNAVTTDWVNTFTAKTGSTASPSWVVASNGADVLSGTAGQAEVFAFFAGSGADVVNGFATTAAAGASHDTVALIGSGIGSFAALQSHISASGGSTVIALGGGSSITLSGVAASSLQGSDFRFA